MAMEGKLEMLRKLSEAELTRKVLIPLYESKGMGCKNVRYTHNRLEFGKDVVYFKEDEYGNRIYTGIQVKRTAINSKNIDNILRQVHEAFGAPFTDLSDGKKKGIDRMVVLTPDEFSKDVKESFWADLRGANLNKLVTCVDGKQLVELVDKHLPSAFWEEYDYFAKYFEAMRRDFTTIKDISALGQKEAVPLEETYVSLRVTEEIREREMPSEEEWKIFDEGLRRREKEEREEQEVERRAEKARVVDAERAVADYDRLVIIGAPGSGKTTLLKYLALTGCKENLERQQRTCVPIPITLREWVESGKKLREYIDDVFEKYEFPKAKKFVEKDLKGGRCRVLLDGFDELATKENQEKVADEVQRFGKKYRKCQMVVTSRLAGYHDELKGYTKAELIEFDDKQIGKFIENWFGRRDPERAKLMLDAVMGNEQKKRLARSPLMIAIIAVIYEEDRKLPQRRADLYERCVEVLLSKWDVQKRLKNRFASAQKEFVLRKLAFYGHINNKRVMTEKEVVGEMLRHFGQVGLKEEDAKAFLDEIRQRSYLLRQISMERYDFLHLSFQEYFTALELKEREDGISVIIEHVAEPWWEEPILLYAGTSRDASGLIKRVREEVPEDMFYSNLMLFGRCVADAEFTEVGLRGEIVDELWSLYRTAEFARLKEKTLEVFAVLKPDSVIDSLVRDLRGAGKDSSVRWSSAEALGRIGSEKAIEPLLKALGSDKEAGVRWRSAEALGSIGSEKAIEPLVEALGSDKDSYVRWRSAEALGRIGSEKAVEALVKALGSDKASSVRGSSAYALGSIGSEKAIEGLLKALGSDQDTSVRGSSAYALGRIGSEKAIEPLVEALGSDKASSVRGRSAEALGSIGSEKAIEPLVKALGSDKASDVRGSSAAALGSIGSEKAVEGLLKALGSDKASDVRWSSAYALGSIGSEKAVGGLEKALKDEGEWGGGKVKDAAFAALERISKRSKLVLSG